jgi:hypothetical protein
MFSSQINSEVCPEGTVLASRNLTVSLKSPREAQIKAIIDQKISKSFAQDETKAIRVCSTFHTSITTLSNDIQKIWKIAQKMRKNASTRNRTADLVISFIRVTRITPVPSRLSHLTLEKELVFRCE